MQPSTSHQVFCVPVSLLRLSRDLAYYLVVSRQVGTVQVYSAQGQEEFCTGLEGWVKCPLRLEHSGVWEDYSTRGDVFLVIGAFDVVLL